MTRHPDFFIVGAPKCGTTALYEYLRAHPGVFMPQSEKEPHFFSTDILNRDHCRYEHLSDYVRLFSGAEAHQLVGEASVYYLFSSVAIRRILEVNPEAKFIAMIRNPVEMAYSLHAELLRSLLEDVDDFEQAWYLQRVRSVGRRLPQGCSEPRLLQYKNVCSLAFQVRRFFDLVPPEQRHVIVFDDLKNNPRAVYEATLSFLGLVDDGRDIFERVHPNAVLRNKQFAALLCGARRQLGPAYLPLRRGLHRLGLRPFWTLWKLNTRESPRKPLRPSFHLELQEVFKEEVRSLEILLGRSFSHWLAAPLLSEAVPTRSAERASG